MSDQTRFGRKIRLPSTSVIKHQLRMMTAIDTLAEKLLAEGGSKQELGAIVGKMMVDYKISLDRAHMLLDRIRVDRTFLVRA